MRVAAGMLAANAQAHGAEHALFAWADVFDNSREAGATVLDIALEEPPPPDVPASKKTKGARARARRPRQLVTMQDDGCGMSEKTLREMLGGLGYTDKDSESTGKHYGMGSKTGLMRMSPQGVLVFTVKDGNWAVGLLSTTLSEELGLSQECVFFCSWDAATRERVTTTTPTNPLSAEAREQSLAVIKELSLIHI